MPNQRVSPPSKALWVLLLFLSAGLSSPAQDSKGSISGTVVDSQNAVVAGANVKSTNLATNQEFHTATNSDGLFRANLLPIGNYRVEISKIGFRQLLFESLSVTVGADRGLGYLELIVGDVNSTVVVRSTSGLIESTEAQISNSLGEDILTSYSGILDNNGLDNLAVSVPGVVASRDLSFASTNGIQFSVNGLRGRNTDQQIDGQNNNDNSQGGPSLPLSDSEFVAEYQITTSNFGAEYGRSSGSVVNILTKSGTNSLHGSLYGSEGNWRFDTLSTNQKAWEGLTRVPANNDIFVGATIGGAVIHDKLFLFGGLDSEILNQSSVFGTGLQTPTPAGVATLAACYPQSTAVAALQRYGPYSVRGGNPSPQGPVTAVTYPGCSGVALAGVQRTLSADSRQHSFIIKSDYQTEKNRFYGRYIYRQANFLNSGGNAAAGYPFDSPSLSQDYGFSWTRFFSSSLANEFRGSYGRLNTQDGGNSLGNTVPLSGQLANALTFVSFSDPNLLSFGVQSNLPQGRIVNAYELQDNWTYLLGRNSLKAGANLSYQRSPNIFLASFNGTFRFDDYGALALNLPNRIQIASGNSDLDFRENDAVLYFADDFRLAHHLTLNMGMTWSYFTQPANLFHALTMHSETSHSPLWDPSLPLGVTTTPAIPASKNDWAPGAGFAWSPQKSVFGAKKAATVIRGGYRLAYDPAFYNIYTRNATAAPLLLLNTLTGANAIANPLPAIPTGNNVRTLLGPYLQTGVFDPRTFAETSIAPNFGPDHVHQWSLGMEQEIVPSAAFEIRYVGNHGQNLFQTIDANPFIEGLANLYPGLLPAGVTPCSANHAAVSQSAGRVSCDTGVVRERTNTGYSDYHGLQTDLRLAHLWNQLTLRSAYTFSKTTDNTTEISATGAAGNTSAFSQSQVNFTSQEHGLSGIDFPHALALTIKEDLPFYPTPQTMLGRLFGGWSVSAVYSLASGQPYTAVQFGLNCGSGGGACGGIPDSVNPYDYRFNAAFAIPDGSLRPFAGNPAAPVESVAIFAGDGCAVDQDGNLCGDPAISPNTLVSLNGLNQGLTGTASDRSGNIAPDPGHPAKIVTPSQVRFIANTAAAARVFGTPFGNVGRNTLRDFRTNLLNLSVLKSANVSETIKLQFHADFLNAFNHPNYATIDPFLDDAGLVGEGTGFANPYTQPSGDRTIRFGLKILF